MFVHCETRNDFIFQTKEVLKKIRGSGAESTELEFLKSLWGLGTEEEEGYRTGNIGWRNSFLGIDSRAP